MLYGECVRKNRLLRCIHQWYWRSIREDLWYQWRLIPILRIRYFLRLREVRKIYGMRKLRVAFPVSNLAKWKEQSIYDAMLASDKFEPFVVLTPMDIESEKSHEEKCAIIAGNKEFFVSMGMRVEVAYDMQKGVCLPFSVYSPDIVWYTQPWKIDQVQMPQQVSKFALTCYTPYFVQNYGGLDLDCGPRFHRHLWRHFTLNERWAKVFMEYQGFRRAGRVVGLGHPMLDVIKPVKHKTNDTKVIIYAPHWSCNTGECFSTFLDTGRRVLRFAQAHTSVQWVFKPHPTLRLTLKKNCGWSDSDISEYYSAWEKLGVSCYDGKYVELFSGSTCMLTDCASFLVEYVCTGNPIIHLISPSAKYKPHPIAQELFDTYYQVRNCDELEFVLKQIGVEGFDPKREDRIVAVKRMRLIDNNAAENIIKYIEEIFE